MFLIAKFCMGLCGVAPKWGRAAYPSETDQFLGRFFEKSLPEAEENTHATFARLSSKLRGSFVLKEPKPMFVLLLILHANVRGVESLAAEPRMGNGKPTTTSGSKESLFQSRKSVDDGTVKPWASFRLKT